MSHAFFYTVFPFIDMWLADYYNSTMVTAALTGRIKDGVTKNRIEERMYYR